MTKRNLAFLILIFATVAGLFAWVAFKAPLEERLSINVGFLGYTNVAGTRSAAFTVSNHSKSAIRRLSNYRVQTQVSNRWINISFGTLMGGTAILPAGSSEVVTIIAPTNQMRCRLRLTVSPHVGVAREAMVNAIQATRSSLGLQHRMTQGAYCDWNSE
jgi:hypothetical protein